MLASMAPLHIQHPRIGLLHPGWRSVGCWPEMATFKSSGLQHVKSWHFLAKKYGCKITPRCGLVPSIFSSHIWVITAPGALCLATTGVQLVHTVPACSFCQLMSILIRQLDLEVTNYRWCINNDIDNGHQNWQLDMNCRSQQSQWSQCQYILKSPIHP